ncbi:spore coat protein CotH, partial [Acinetobacter baumannii]|nr:spore coat protein CotH [Acinetobacter baumannii]
SEVGGDTVLAVSDNTGNMLASLNSKGEWYFTKIIADEVVTPFGSSSESLDEVIEQTEIAIPELSFYRIDFTMVGQPPTDLGETTVSGVCSF